MAVKDKTQSTSAAGRRFFFGSNVTIVILLVTFVTIAVNLIANRRNVRRDLASGLASYRLSDRTKRIIDQSKGGFRITTVYTSDEPESDRKKYAPKVRDLCEEIRQYNKNVTVEHLYSGEQRAELRNRVQGKFGTAAGKYKEVIDLANGTWAGLKEVLVPFRAEVEELGDSWLSGFSVLAQHRADLVKDPDNIAATQREVEDLVRGEGIPRYKEANDKIKKTNDDLKKHLEETRDWLKDMNKLVEVLAGADSEFAKQTRAKLVELRGLTANLAKIAGDPADVNVPDDAKPVIQDFAKAANGLAEWLVEESARIGAFVAANPAIEAHRRWQVQTQRGPVVMDIPLPVILASAAQQLSGDVERLRGFLQDQLPKDTLQNVVRQLRQRAQEVGRQLDELWMTNVEAVLDEAGKIDPKSKEFLAKGAGGELFKGILDKLNEVSTKIGELPELKLDEVAKSLQGDNIVVIENDKNVRVVEFDKVWPIADPMAARMGADDEAARRRVFDGDSAVASAMLSMQADKPFATVLFVAYETDASPQMQQFGQRRNTGRLALSELDTLKEKLKDANFAVKEWNLGAEGEEAKKPEPEEGTTAIYVFLPPAPPPQQDFMMGRQPQQKSFGEAELEQVRGALAEKARGLFLAAWELPRSTMFGQLLPPVYGYDQMLQDEWGVKIRFDHRLLRGVPDKRDPELFALDSEQIGYMQLSSFTDQPIGKPLRARRMLMNDVCPVALADKVPEQVVITTVLEVPATLRDVWAESNEGIRRISQVLNSGERGGQFSKDPKTSQEPPFPVIVAAENKEKNGKIVVMGTAVSLDERYLTRRVARFEGKRGALLTDPPPLENVDLFVNAVYWLADLEDLIAAGPVDLPLVPPIEAGGKRNLWLMTVGWAFAVLIIGGVVVFLRSK